jgi:branched-chain amino acid transport system substrate-binding protein
VCGPFIQAALIESLSGAFANTGEAVFRNLLWAVERVNQRGGVKLPAARAAGAGALRQQGPARGSAGALRSAIDDGAQVVLQGNSSAVAAALVDAIQAQRARAAARVLFLNYSAVDPVLTNERCSFWHFRFDAHADMRMAALMQVLKDDQACAAAT